MVNSANVRCFFQTTKFFQRKIIMFLENRICFVRLNAILCSFTLLKTLDINIVCYIDEVLCRKSSPERSSSANESA